MATPEEEAHLFASGLTELCRTALMDVIRQDATVVSDPDVLQCALLFEFVAVWSGEKWHMEVNISSTAFIFQLTFQSAMYQKPMFLEMILNAGFLDHHQGDAIELDYSEDLASLWTTWRERERKRRLAYSWVALDQETCLFHDAASIISSNDLNTPTPEPEIFWQAATAEEWAEVVPRSKRLNLNHALSLHDYVQRFVEAENASQLLTLSPLEVRLLLHPVHAITRQLRELLRCVSSLGKERKTNRHVSRAVISVQVEQVQSILEKWHGICEAQMQRKGISCAATCANMIMYHLIKLNILVDFVEVERMARGEGPRAGLQSTQPSQKRLYHLEEKEEIYFHCGQVLRFVRFIPEPIRPLWWPAAIYRVALIMWANSTTNADGSSIPKNSNIEDNEEPVAIDSMAPNDPVLALYLQEHVGTPVLTGGTAGIVTFRESENILQHCAGLLRIDCTTCLARGLRQKLLSMAERWESVKAERDYTISNVEGNQKSSRLW
ncbi:hypothetical protein MMC25_005057 [Agyrium rufum]|nr:hypothetical protein [Agyrium rufum]